MRLQTLHGSGVSGGFAVRYVGRYMLAFAQLPGQTRRGFDRFGFVGMTVKAALARAVVWDAVGPVAGRHFAAVDFDCGTSDFDESRPRSTIGSFVFFHVNYVICVARIAP